MKSISLDKNKIYCSILIFLFAINPLLFTLDNLSSTTIFYRVPHPAQSELELTIGVMGFAGDWDMAITDTQNILYNYYRLNSLEPLIWQHYNS